jgi:hypothetical protein
MAKADREAGKREHKATYARDKKKGGYLVRVQGPHANAFVGREVPVQTKDGSEHPEKLTQLIWTGTDDGEISGYTGPCALYAFEAKPKEAQDEIPF